MNQSAIDRNIGKQNPLFNKRPPGVLLDEKQWLFLKERYQMTPRELQVAILVCRGFDNNEMARDLKISRGTVKTHLRNIYRRVRVKSKVTLLLRFIEDVNKFYVPSGPSSPSVPISQKPIKPGFLPTDYQKK